MNKKTGGINKYKAAQKCGLMMVLAGFIVLPGCAAIGGHSGADEPVYVGELEIDDSFENTNRAVFSFNTAVDDAVIHPVVKGYRAVVPDPAREGLRNVLRTLKSPVTFGNQVLQGDVEGATNVVMRTVINVFVGLGGVFDVAGSEGIPYEAEDFGQTLAVWGVDHGPYLVVPFLGPSSVRDYAGYAVDGFADPLRWYLFNIDEDGLYYTKVALDYLDLRESLVDVLEDLQTSSIDYYAATRSIYYQRRQALVEDRSDSAGDAPEIPNYDQ
jgi:phospholipid-binding lipoprotein MlaA